MRLCTVLVLVTAMFAAGCGGDDDPDFPDIETLFPADNELGSWTEHTVVNDKVCRAGVQVATTDQGIVDIINGGAGPFLDRDYNAFGAECYTDGTYELELRVWQFVSAGVADELYAALLTESSTHQSSTWENATFGDQSRVANTQTDWWFNLTEGEHLLEVKILEDGAAPDAASKTAGETFVNGVLAKM